MSKKSRDARAARQSVRAAPESSPTPWYKRVTTYVIVAVLTPLLAGAGNWLWTAHIQPAAERTIDPLKVNVVPVPQPEASPTVAPSPLRSPSSQASAPGSASASTSRSRAPGLTVGARQSFPPGAQWVFAGPLPIGSEASLYRAYGSPKSAADTTSVDTEALDNWATRGGAYNLEATEVRAVLQARSRPVTVVGVRARIVERRRIPATTVVVIPPQGGEDTIRTDLQLDRAEPTAGYFADHHIKLAPNESATLDVRAEALRSAVVWDLVLDVVADGRRTSLLVTRADGQHFRTAGWVDEQHHRSGPAGADDSPPPWQEYQHAIVFDVGALKVDQEGRPVRQDPAEVWKRCRGADLLKADARTCPG